MQSAATTTTTIRSLLGGLRAQPADGVLQADGAALLGLAIGRPRAWLYAHSDAVVDPAAAARFAALCARRLQGEPLAYLCGRREFWSMELCVSPATLVPRPETELLVECALRLCTRPRAQVLDLGTGSGAVALALARERPQWQVLGTDIDPAAVAVAEANAVRLGSGARFAQGDWYAAVAGARFDLVVSNPPYIRADDPCLDGDGLRCEPRRALASGADGLDALRVIAAAAPLHLRAGGVLACEHGAAQGAQVRALFAAAGLVAIGTAPDLAGLERVTHGLLPAERADG